MPENEVIRSNAESLEHLDPTMPEVLLWLTLTMYKGLSVLLVVYGGLGCILCLIIIRVLANVTFTN